MRQFFQVTVLLYLATSQMRCVGTAAECPDCRQTSAELVPPDDETLCGFVMGETTLAAAEAALGPGDRRETSESITLLYQYSNGMTLFLLFRDDVFADATVYNGRYPECWAKTARGARDELNGIIEEEIRSDAGADRP